MPGTPHDSTPIELAIPSDKVAEWAVQDTARYQEQLVKLILFHDDRALRVLSVYVPVIVALVTAAVALNDKLTLYIGCMIGGTAFSLLLGCLSAFAVAWTAPIFLPGRKPDFWAWAIEHGVQLQPAALAYVKQSADMITHNELYSDRASNYLMKAYLCGIAAPVVGAAIVWVVYWS